MMKPAAAFALSLALATACSPADPPQAAPDPAADEPDIQLEAVTANSVNQLEGELRCSFKWDHDNTVLLMAAANVGDMAQASAAITLDGMGRKLAGRGEGGFGALEKTGGVFSGEDVTVTITPGEEVAGEMSESVVQAATLNVQRPEGGPQTYDGVWTCGP
ncbi:MAG: hypothetical protein ABJL57_01700 [Hyphomonas sp.]|jgi:hypothetical protein|uniref:hypothetical protein n=1 Tax=Hyphomonas sp. TaxID=87 RepID=UPI0032656958